MNTEAEMWVRLDDRLLHSELVYACLPVWKPSKLFVVSEPARLKFVDTSVVEGLEVQVTTPGELAGLSDWSDGSCLVFGTPADLGAAIRSGVPVKQALLANRRQRLGARSLGPHYWVDDAEAAQISDWLRTGVDVVLQRVPSDEPVRVDSDATALHDVSRERG
ncbi:MAG: PTS sugar transporter subunit IIB [Myxococcales bacterium]|nr:PTS sugar transporter subunit IIB [Myxococcales bacterium]